MMGYYPQFPLTDFPNNVDTFPQFLDLVQSDYPYLVGYQEALQEGNTTLAQQYLQQLPQASQKIVSAMRLNQLRDAILALEQFYSTDVEDYIDSKETEWTSYIDRFKYIGVYNPTISYTKNNIVQYTANGLIQLYINIYDGVTPIGTLPTNTTYWRVLTIRGDKGESGVGGSFMFNWESSVTYRTNNIVVYNAMWWIALQDSLNEPPMEGSEYWEMVLKTTQPIYPVQSLQPSDQETGEMWFKVL